MNKLRSNLNKKTRKTFLFISLFLFLICTSCYPKKTQNTKNRFIAIIDLTSNQDNSIQLFYKLNADDRYYEEYSLKKKIKGKTSSQRLSFELPYGIKPKNIRIDLGENENVSIKLENIRFKYKNQEIKGDKGLYKSWFVFNENVIRGKDSLTFEIKKVNAIFDPQLNGNRKLNAKLVKLFPPDINETNLFTPKKDNLKSGEPKI
jgi:hypothetical protein